MTDPVEFEILRRLGERWAADPANDNRNCPSRRCAYLMALAALGRTPTSAECARLQRAAERGVLRLVKRGD